MSNIAVAAENLQSVLLALGWEPTLDEGSMGFFVDLGLPHVPLRSVYAAISIDAEQLVVYFDFGLAAPVERRDEVARFIIRANWGLMIGNFEMDYDDGQVRFKSSIDFSETELTETLIRDAIRPAMTALETYADALVEVISGRKGAVEAIKGAEVK